MHKKSQQGSIILCDNFISHVNEKAGAILQYIYTQTHLNNTFKKYATSFKTTINKNKTKPTKNAKENRKYYIKKGPHTKRKEKSQVIEYNHVAI